MSARDKYHDAVKNALVQDGWTITHDPYGIAIGRRRGYIDLGAEIPLMRILEWIETKSTESS